MHALEDALPLGWNRVVRLADPYAVGAVRPVAPLVPPTLEKITLASKRTFKA